MPLMMVEYGARLPEPPRAYLAHDFATTMER
jgi:hypothetical protein